MRLIGYARVSTDDQATDGHSINQQPDRLRAYCAQQGHELVRIIVDAGEKDKKGKRKGVSSGRPLNKRRGGMALISALNRGEADGVVITRLDRMFRNTLEGLQFIYGEPKRGDRTVMSISEAIDTRTPAGKLALTINLATGQYERDIDIQRATECNAALRGAGKVYGCVPYGCIERDGLLYRVPALWRMREAIVRNLRNGTSLRIQQAALADANVRSPTGKARWSLNTLWGLQHHHDELARLPFVAQHTDGAVKTCDTGVSGGMRIN
jgi:site-specific DNA recombinase